MAMAGDISTATQSQTHTTFDISQNTAQIQEKTTKPLTQTGDVKIGGNSIAMLETGAKSNVENIASSKDVSYTPMSTPTVEVNENNLDKVKNLLLQYCAELKQKNENSNKVTNDVISLFSANDQEMLSLSEKTTFASVPENNFFQKIDDASKEMLTKTLESILNKDNELKNSLIDANIINKDKSVSEQLSDSKTLQQICSLPEVLSSIIKNIEEEISSMPTKYTQEDYKVSNDLQNLMISAETQKTSGQQTSFDKLSSAIKDIVDGSNIAKQVMQAVTNSDNKTTDSLLTALSTNFSSLFRESSFQQILSKIGDDVDNIDFSKLNADCISMLCMLLTQKSKQAQANILKSMLQNKLQLREQKSESIVNEQKKVDAENKRIEEKQKKAKKWGIFRKVFAAIAAAVAVVVSVASLGTASGPMMVLAGLAITAAILDTVKTSLETAGVNLSAVTGKVLSYVSMALTIASAAGGMGMCVAKGTAGMSKMAADATAEATKAVTQQISSTTTKIATGLQSISTIGSGISSIGEGIQNMSIAESQRKVATFTIELEKLNEEIELLQQALKDNQDWIKKIIEQFLNVESLAASEASNINDTNSHLAKQIA